MRTNPTAFALAPLLFAAWACDSTTITDAGSGFEVGVEEVSFPDTWIGHPSTAEVPIRNLGRARLHLELQSTSPFHAPASISVPGAGEALVTVEFAPTTEGAHASTLVVGTGEAAVTVALEGNALPIPPCDPGDECRRFSFDPAAGACVPDPMPDGTRCGDACLDEGECRGGVCVGSATACEPGDACTGVSCDPTDGCVYFDKTETCPGSDDPCRAPVCDPEVGCGFEAAPDGTPCGPSDCSSAYICLRGECTLSETPDGGPCGDESPCQERGVCRRGECVQPPKTTLLQTWTNAASGTNQILFAGTTDLEGNLYWAECDALRCSLVKATPEGFELYREPMSDGTVPVGALAVAGERIVSTLRLGWIEAYDLRRGELVWSRDVGPIVLDGAEGAWVELGELVVHGFVATVTAEGWVRKPTLRLVGGWVVAVDLHTGEPRWSRSFGGSFSGLIGDAAGRLFLSAQDAGAAPSDPARLVSLGPSGGDRWTVMTPYRPPLAVSDDMLLQASGELRLGDDGSAHAALDLMIPLFPESPLLGGRHGWVFGYPMGDCSGEPCPIWTPKLFRFDPIEGVLQGDFDVVSGDATQRTEPVLTTTGGIIFAEAIEGGPGCQRTFRLIDLEPDGEVGFECLLPKGRYGGATSLHGGRWAVLDTCGNHAIKVFTLDGYDLAPKGWVTARGNPGRTGKPR
ncbi:MAG TPA: hypothetical protein VN033_01865 [Vulgatibacter sp.]|nr:hypothetical protein [Vulgatibacter sp.]